jgi:hypothetical protein
MQENNDVVKRVTEAPVFFYRLLLPKHQCWTP